MAANSGQSTSTWTNIACADAAFAAPAAAENSGNVTLQEVVHAALRKRVIDY